MLDIPKYMLDIPKYMLDIPKWKSSYKLKQKRFSRQTTVKK